MAANVVYGLCALTALACALLLWRSWGQSQVRLLYWTAICFSLLFVNNAMLLLDENVGPGIADLELARALTGFGAVAFLVYGLVTEER